MDKKSAVVTIVAGAAGLGGGYLIGTMGSEKPQFQAIANRIRLDDYHPERQWVTLTPKFLGAVFQRTINTRVEIWGYFLDGDNIEAVVTITNCATPGSTCDVLSAGKIMVEVSRVTALTVRVYADGAELTTMEGFPPDQIFNKQQIGFYAFHL